MKTKIVGGYIIGFDGTKHVLLKNSEVVFQESRIIFVGKSYTEKVDRIVDATDKLILPGLINIHTHSLTAALAYRGICEDEGQILYKYLLPIRCGTTSRPPYATTCLDAFNAVTLNAAKALRRKEIGRISPGAKADIILILMEQRNILTVDEEEVISKANDVTKRIWRKSEAEIDLPRLLLNHVQKV